MTHSKTDSEVSGIKTQKSSTRKRKSNRMAPPTNGEILVRGVAMGIIISAITHTSKSITGLLIRHPLTLFSAGMVTGYLTHKYRKEIIAVTARTAVESKNVVLRQREHLIDLVAEIKEERQETGK